MCIIYVFINNSLFFEFTIIGQSFSLLLENNFQQDNLSKQNLLLDF